ncbi:Gfo/Idh/MocA family protein [Microlunatus sp. Y2014]|uniref:Gfo/Idh/MocA family protein n=1 Tax=Microlunatus sp. Y2014 TaxID=3418488 RepID=UPI003DA76E08
MTEVRVGVSGLGSIGGQHLAALRAAGATTLYGFDAVPAMCEAAQAATPDLRLVDSYDALLGSGLDAVVIAVPDHAHLAQLEAAASAGIAVLVEKPLAPSAAETAAVIDRLGTAGDRCMVGYVLRHNAACLRVAGLLADKAIGESTSFQVMLGAYGTITVAANRFATPAYGRLYGDYSHEWDYLAWWFGPIASVLAVERTTAAVPHVETPNLVDALLETGGGMVGALHIDYVDQRGLRQVTVIGTEGSLTTDLGGGVTDVRRTGIDGVQRFSDLAPASAALTRQAAHLLAVARDEEQPRVRLTDGLAALRVADALRASAPTRTWAKVGA